MVLFGIFAYLFLVSGFNTKTKVYVNYEDSSDVYYDVKYIDNQYKDNYNDKYVSDLVDYIDSELNINDPLYSRNVFALESSTNTCSSKHNLQFFQKKLITHRCLYQKNHSATCIAICVLLLVAIPPHTRVYPKSIYRIGLYLQM